jgi:hypothetical protein
LTGLFNKLSLRWLLPEIISEKASSRNVLQSALVKTSSPRWFLAFAEMASSWNHFWDYLVMKSLLRWFIHEIISDVASSRYDLFMKSSSECTFQEIIFVMDIWRNRILSVNQGGLSNMFSRIQNDLCMALSTSRTRWSSQQYINVVHIKRLLSPLTIKRTSKLIKWRLVKWETIIFHSKY